MASAMYFIMDVILSRANYKFVTFSDITVRKPEDYYYLTDRNENAIDPTEYEYGYGVPQGSILGPLLFLLFINDISNVLPELKVKLFADDTNILLFNRDINILFIEANLALEKINSWFNANKFVINIEKTHYCIFNSHNNLRDVNVQLPVLKIENKIIEFVKNTKYLGINIDNSLTFKEHINNIISSVKKFCGIFYKFRSRLPLTCLKTIYFAMIHSHLNYGIEIYANTYNSFLDPLVKINNKF